MPLQETFQHSKAGLTQSLWAARFPRCATRAQFQEADLRLWCSWQMSTIQDTRKKWLATGSLLIHSLVEDVISVAEIAAVPCLPALAVPFLLLCLQGGIQHLLSFCVLVSVPRVTMWCQSFSKIMASGLIISWQIDRKTVETVTDFIFLGSKITADGDCSHEIKRRLLLGRKAMTNLGSILKSRDIASKGLSTQSYGFSSSHIWM